MSKKQFNQVNTRYGAPMGRPDSGYISVDVPRSIRLFRVNLDSGGYDYGGAYWGHGDPIYCARDGDGNQQFTRAHSRRAAALLLGIPDTALIRPLGADALHYGVAILDGRCPAPRYDNGDPVSRDAVIQWLRGTGRYFDGAAYDV